MKRLQKTDVKGMIRQIKAKGISTRRQFAIYILSAIALVLSFILLLLNLSGVMNPANAQIMEVLDTQLLSYADHIEHDYNKIAAHAISFADQLEDEIDRFLTEKQLVFEDLRNNADALSAMQCDLYQTVYLNMQLTPSSGAFYILDTTVNGRSEPQLYNGIYLKYINLYSESVVNNEIALYRGSFSTAKEGNLTFHSGWNNEMRTDFFNHCESEFAKDTYYILSPTVEIPDTWERARYVYVPLRDSREQIIGVCGYEVNDLYFQLSKKANDSRLGQLVGALLEKEQESYSGQFSSNRYNTTDSDTVTITEKKNSTVFDFETERCIGRTQNITLGNRSFTVVLMMTEAQYNAHIRQGQLKIAGIILFVFLFAFACCLFMTKKHVAHEEQLKTLQAARQAAEEEVLRTRAAYEKALEECDLAQRQILHLTEEQKKRIVLEDYDYFICNLKTLTPAESRIYELYLEGKTTQEIASLLGIQENTMKYHNKNIYSKLGVSSRKQLLRFATLKQQQDKKALPDA